MPSKGSPSSGDISKSGITTDTHTGERYIPSSVRFDGSVRKEVKIRPGYRPQEDVEVYKNRTAEAWKNRGKGGVPGAEAIGEDKGDQNAANNKNAKRREARKRAAETAKEGEGAGEEDLKVEPKTEEKKEEEVDPEEQKAKEAKKLAKKLRQARELKDKKEKGDKLLPEQFEKVIRINELIRQLDALGFDADGEIKTDV